jgi:hypothetical protein
MTPTWKTPAKAQQLQQRSNRAVPKKAVLLIAEVWLRARGARWASHPKTTTPSTTQSLGTMSCKLPWCVAVLSRVEA